MKNALLLAILAIAILAASCSHDQPIIGKWRMTRFVTYWYRSSLPPQQLDMTDTSAINRLFRDRLPPSAWNNELFDKARDCYFQFKKDSTFRMYDIGVALRGIPGLLFGEDMPGKWYSGQDSVITIQTKGTPFVKKQTLVYKIIKLSNDSLVLGHAYDYTPKLPIGEIYFVRE